MTLYRILLNPDQGEGGEPAGDEMVSISASELEALRLASGGAARPSDAAAEAEDRLREAERRHDEELSRLAKKAERWEGAFKAALKEKELAAALAGRPLVPGAAAQLIKLWREELSVVDEADGPRVAARDGRPVAEAVASWLSGPEYAHFSRAGSRGGTAPPGDSRSSATGPQPSPPRTLGEAVLDRWREAAQAARRDPAAPIGLGRRRP
ncbi:hypothetical protein [Tautonia plasticadhaerens]|uniref:Uncharacterized protein n=1 Tax=Tautonia plasticadhaerens TaxID=2527974 RepID=A0A518HBN6_9BACT|nr:hypothetical protein [Tautonia plasticadhaerens]QDV38274.1 hypothetical protein ElP_62250 [Tautonia plasticadhaerens]